VSDYVIGSYPPIRLVQGH